MSDDASILFDYIRQTCGDCNHPHCLSIIEDAKQTLQPTRPVDGKLREVIENILDDFGHDVVNNPQGSRRSLQSKPIKQLEQLFAAHLRAAVREAELNLAKETRVKMSIYSQKELDAFLAMKIAESVNQGEK